MNRENEPQEVVMSRLIRMDSAGHTTLAEWTAGDGASAHGAVESLRAELERGNIAVVHESQGRARQVRELPIDAGLVIVRRPITGG